MAAPKNTIATNISLAENNADSVTTKNLNKIYATKEAIIIANNRLYAHFAEQAPDKNVGKAKYAYTNKKASTKKIAKPITAKSSRAYIASEASENRVRSALLFWEGGAIANPQRNLSQNFLTEPIASIAHNYLIVFALLFLLLALYFEKILDSDFFNRPPPKLYNTQQKNIQNKIKALAINN